MDGNTVKWLCFTGTAEDYPAWSLYANKRAIQIIARKGSYTKRNPSTSQRCIKTTESRKRN